MKKFNLPELPYAHNALEPTIDEETMKLHHGKHHQAYVNNLNDAVEGLDLDCESVEDLLRNLDQVPEDKKQAVINNGGGHANHSLFWETMTPGGSKEPVGALAEKIDEVFGGFDAFKEEFQKAGTTQFGSGWAWLVLDNGELKVTKTANQASPLMHGQDILLGNDVWEHAYYLKYKNVRADYLKAWWDVVNWDVVGKRYDELVK